MLNVNPSSQTPWEDKAETPVENDPNQETILKQELLDNENKIQVVQDDKKTVIKLPSIIVKGSLGSLITKELNEIYEVKDDDIDSLPEIQVVTQSEESFLYATDLSENHTGILSSLNNAIEKYKNVVLYVKLEKEIPTTTAILEDFCRENNIKITYSKEVLKDKLCDE